MINSTVTTKISAAFLATVLVAGIIALSSPSFMVGAQAEPGYGMEKKYNSYEEPDYGMDSYEMKSYGNDDNKSQYSSYGKDNRDKSKDSNNVIVKKVKCNNINVNVNGLELNVLPPFLSDLLGSEAQASDEGYSGASSYGNGGSDESYGDGKSSSGKSFKFICINNNNNTVVQPPPVPPVPPVPVDECEDCFENVTLTFPITVDLPNLDITIDDFEELCELIFSPPFSQSAEQLLRLVTEIVPDGTPEEDIEAIVCDCLAPLLGIRGACPPGPPA